jgi:hypothetical protein
MKVFFVPDNIQSVAEQQIYRIHPFLLRSNWAKTFIASQ